MATSIVVKILTIFPIFGPQNLPIFGFTGLAALLCPIFGTFVSPRVLKLHRRLRSLRLVARRSLEAYIWKAVEHVPELC